MKSPRNHTIEVTKRVDQGRLPLFLEMGHKHLEKGQPTAHGSDFFDGSKAFTVPVDILRLSHVPEDILDGIEEITFAYRAK